MMFPGPQAPTAAETASERGQIQHDLRPQGPLTAIQTGENKKNFSSTPKVHRETICLGPL